MQLWILFITDCSSGSRWLLLVNMRKKDISKVCMKSKLHKSKTQLLLYFHILSAIYSYAYFCFNILHSSCIPSNIFCGSNRQHVLAAVPWIPACLFLIQGSFIHCILRGIQVARWDGRLETQTLIRFWKNLSNKTAAALNNTAPQFNKGDMEIILVCQHSHLLTVLVFILPAADSEMFKGLED